MSIDVRHEPTRHRYEALVDGVLAGFTQYRPDAEGDAARVLSFVHTEVDDAFAGQGVASVLVRQALDDVRSRGLQIRAVCPFVRRYLERHAEYQDLLAA
jgi:predicted GNAT family acetyltransferase